MSNDQQKQDLTFTPHQEKILNGYNGKKTTTGRLLQRLAGKVRSNQLNYDLFGQLAEASQETSNIQNKEFDQFLEILNRLDLTELPARGEGLYELIKILVGRKKGNPSQQKFVRGVLLELRNKRDGFKLQPDWLEATLGELRHLDHIEETPQEVADETNAGVAFAETRGGTRGRAKEIITEKKSPYEMEALDSTLQEELNRLEKQELELQAKYNEYDRAGKVVKRDEIQKQLDALFDLLEPLRLRSTAHFQRLLARRQAIKESSRQLGIDLLNAGKIKTEAGLVEIDQIYFDPDGRLEIDRKNEPDSTQKLDPRKESSAGTMLISYRLNGVPQEKKVYTNFRDFLLSNSAVQEVRSLSELQQRIGPNNGFKNLEPGQTFHSSITKQTFTVKSIDSDRQIITIEPQITIRFAGQLSRVARTALKNDLLKSKLSFSEFATYLIAQEFRRDISTDEVPSIIQKNFQLANEIIAEEEGPESSLLKEKPPSIPRTVGQSQAMYFRIGRTVYQGTLELQADGNYKFTPGKFQPTDLNRRGIPARFQVLGQRTPSTGMSNTIKEWIISLKKDPEKIQLPPPPLILSPWEVVEQSRQDNFCDVPSDVSIALKTPVRPMHSTLNPGVKDQIELPDEEPPSPATPTPPPAAAAEEEEEEEGGFDPNNPPNPEALAYDDVYRYKPAAREEEGFLKSLYKSTKFLSVSDLWQMGTTMWEYYDRRYKNRQKQRYASIGKDLKYFGPEMQRINQQTETDEMNQFKDALDQFGVLQTTERLHTTNNFFELKACFISLKDKGQLRFDDVKMWKNVNRFVQDPSKKIPIPSDGNPFTVVKVDGKRSLTGKDFLKPVLDGFWGDGTYDDWYSGNKSTYQGNTQKYAEEGKELESVPGGYGARLANLLRLHKEGSEFVDPQRYEGLILAAINNGKGSMQDKLYYIIQGVACENKHGRTIMDFSRVAHINSEYLVRFPFLDYICASVPRPPKGERYRFTLADYKHWAKIFDQGKSDNVRPTTAVDEFMWRHALTADQTITRINKVRNYGGYDPDDTFAFFPPLDVQLITDACNMGTVGGGQKSTSTEAYKNIFPGFSQYLKTLAKKGNSSRLVDGINSFIRFESIMSNRFEKNNTIYQRLDQKQINKGSVVSDVKSSVHIAQINALIDKIVDAYTARGVDGAENVREKLALSRVVVSEEEFITPTGKQTQERVNAALKALPGLFNKMIDQDKGAIMLSIAGEIANDPNQLVGMPYSGDEEELDQRKAAAA